MPTATVAAIVVLLLITSPALADPGDPDPDFGDGGTQTTDFSSGYDAGYGMAIQADRKIVLVGTTYNGTDNDFGVARYTTAGVLDVALSGDGERTAAFAGTDEASDVAIQANGRIVVVGATSDGADWDFAIARFRAGGALDHSFSGDGKRTVDLGGGNQEANGVAIQEDGKIVVVGYTDHTGENDWLIVRLNLNGSLDQTFSGDGTRTTDFGPGFNRAADVAIQQDGRIVVAGWASNGADSDFAISRYRPGGRLDRRFSGDGKQTTDFGLGYDMAYAVAIQSNGRIVASGDADTGPDIDVALVRYRPGGALDASFDGDGMQTTGFGFGNDRGFDVAIQDDEKFVVVGSATQADQNFAVIRYGTGGELDPSFGSGGFQITNFGFGDDDANAVAIQNNGKIVAAGNAYSGTDPDFALARYLAS